MRRALAAPVVAVLLAVGGGATPAPTAVLTPTAGPSPVVGGPAGGVSAPPSPTVDRTPRDPALTESSGLSASPGHPGLLWTLNDSGNPPLVFGLARDGSTRVRLRVEGVPNVDWEALAAWRDATGRTLLAVGDIGDNTGSREVIEVDVLAEPADLGPAGGEFAVRPMLRLRLTYPDQPKDAEALFVDPRTQRMYVVAKGLTRARFYVVPERVWPGTSDDAGDVGEGTPGTATRSGTLEYIGGVGVGLATDAAVLTGGQVVLRNYASAMLLAPLPPTQQPLQPLATVALPPQPQGEGLAVVDNGILLSSEGRGQPVLRMGLPATFAEAIGAGVSPTSAPTPSATATPSSDAAAASGSASGPVRQVLTVAAGLVALGAALLLGVGAWAVRRRRAGPH